MGGAGAIMVAWASTITYIIILKLKSNNLLIAFRKGITGIESQTLIEFHSLSYVCNIIKQVKNSER